MDEVSDVMCLSDQFNKRAWKDKPVGLETPRMDVLKAEIFSKNSRIKYSTEDEENMTLSTYSDSSSDMFLSSSSLSSTTLSETSNSTSLLSSPRPQQKGKKPQRLNTKLKTTTGRGSTYKHIPHRLKPPHIVAKRNARERKRVQAVNCAFSRLRKHVPFEPRHRRLSKVKTLRFAIEYIQRLQELIANHDRQTSEHQQHIQGMYTHFSHHYFDHHHEQRNFVLNKSTPSYPAETTHEARENSNTPQVSGSLFIHLPRLTSDLHANKSTDEQYVFSQSSDGSFVSASRQCTSYSPQPVKENFSIIHNLSTCRHNCNGKDCVNSNPTTGCLSLTEPSIQLDNAAIYSKSTTETQEMMTYEQQTSHFDSFRQSFLYPDTPGNTDMPAYPNFLGSHFEMTPSSSFDACSHIDNSSTILPSNSIPRMERIFKPPSSNTFLKVNVPDDCSDYTAELAMFQRCSKNMRSLIGDYRLTSRPLHLINIDQDFSFTNSHFDQQVAPLDNYRIQQ